MRSVTTIGNVGAAFVGPMKRAGARMRGYTMGATIANWQPPTAQQLQDMPPSDALANAIVAFLAWQEQNGVPDEHTYNAQVAAIQSAYNADDLAGVTGPLDVDGGYGPNTQALVQAISGSAPALNTAPVSGGGGAVPAAQGTTTTTTTTGGSGLGVFLVLAAAAGAAYLIFGSKKRENPRRRRRGRKGSLEAAFR